MDEDLSFKFEEFYPKKKKKGNRLHIILFVVTFISTTIAGAFQSGYNPFKNPLLMIYGLPFSFTLMGILLVHEMGHYVVSRYYGLPVSLPYFLPAPSFIGTFGAFIKMEAPMPTRNIMIQVGAAGPLAGLAVAIPVTGIGLHFSSVQAVSGEQGLHLGSSILFNLLVKVTIGDIPDTLDIVLHPMAFAGWIGLLVTAFNLLPAGQLDGGHVVYGLLGPSHIKISKMVFLFLIILGIFTWRGWLLWAFLLYIFGLKHPNVIDPSKPTKANLFMGWLCMIILILVFVPNPFSM